MTAGDLDADNFFGLDIQGGTSDASHLEYLALSTVFWIIALILMTILLSNLMVTMHI